MIYPTLLVLTTLCCLIAAAIFRRRNQHPYPPGPPELPVLRSLFHVPVKRQWLAYAQMSHKYESSVVHLRAFGTHIVVINTFEAAKDIFEKRVQLFADCPHVPLLNDIVGYNWIFGFANGQHWKTTRRLFDTVFRENAAKNLRPLEQEATHRLIENVTREPQEFEKHIRLFSIEWILDLGYNIKVKDPQDHFVLIAESSLSSLNQASKPYVVNLLPWLKFLPSSFPGNSWKSKVTEWRKQARLMRDAPFHAPVFDKKDSMKEALLRDSHDENVVKDTVGTLFVAATDTVFSMLHCVILVMLVFPHVQQTIHAEFDDVLGPDRLPTFEDKDKLPYFRAFWKELLRWTCIAPLALPHCATEDHIWKCPDSRREYLIPKGSIVMGNVWAMSRDTRFYPRPEDFDPTRFLGPNPAPNPDFLFGFRPRICPVRPPYRR
ncbi:cytochrome P450 [Flagelloscypha sp. PMI_526]|nr:cytochrome P450 [Flagelloscypha sp. PMI_526]